MLQASCIITRLRFRAQFLQVRAHQLFPLNPSCPADKPNLPLLTPIPLSLSCIYPRPPPPIYFSVQEVYEWRLGYDSTWAGNEGAARTAFLFAAWPLASYCQGGFDCT